jgi:regulator of protease activity HflC (stomatin/prohibitin superfamily)
MGAFDWISSFIEWFGKFFPRWVILDTTEGAVKFVRGKKAIALAAGIHWYWPIMTKMQGYPTAFQADRLPSQTITTTDDKVIIVGSMISYTVDDILPLVATTHSAATTVSNLALSAVHDTCCRMSWEELKVEQRKGTLDTKLRNMAQRRLAKYGVKIDELVLIDLAPTRVLKLLQSTSQEENA